MIDAARKNRSKIWKWALLVMERDPSLASVLLAAVGRDGQGILLNRGGQAVLLLHAGPDEISVSCPTGEKAAWTLPVHGPELRTKDVLPRVLGTIGGASLADPPQLSRTVHRTFEVLGRWTRQSGLAVGTLAGDWVAGRTSVSPSGVARRATGEIAVINGAGLAEDDASLLKDFAETGHHPRRVDLARTPTPPPLLPPDGATTTALSLPDGSVVFGSSAAFRWRPGGDVEQLPMSGTVVGCWSPPGGGDTWVLTSEGQAWSSTSGRVLSPLPAGGSFLAAGARVAWSAAERAVSLTDPEVSSPEQIAQRSRVIPPPPTGDSWVRFLFDDRGHLLWFHGYKDNVVAAFDPETLQWCTWDAGQRSTLGGYGHVGGYDHARGLVTIVKTQSLLLLDRAQEMLWSFVPERRFKHTRAAFSPSGDWILVLGDDALYALTLHDHRLRRLMRVNDVVDVVSHPRGFVLLGNREVVLLDSRAFDGVLADAAVELEMEAGPSPVLPWPFETPS